MTDDVRAQLDALHARIDDLADQVKALADTGASDAALRNVEQRVEQLAGRVHQLER